MFLRLSSAVMTSFLTASLSLSASAGAQSERFSPQQLQEDLQIAKRAIEEAHGGMYRYRPKTYIDQQFADAQTALNHSTDALGFYRHLKPAVASIACGHTAALLPLSIKEAMKHELLLPFEVKILQGRVFVFRDLSGAQQFAGREILSINGMDIKSIVRTMTNAMHGDGNIPTMRAIEVGRAFKELLFTMLQMHGEFKIVLRDPKSKTVGQHQIAGLESDALKQAWSKQYPQDQDSERFLNTVFFEQGKIAYLKIDNFSVTGTDKDGEAILKETFEAIRDQGSHTLVIDVRDNGGGEDALGKLLFSYLVDQPFSYYDALTIKTDKYTMDQYAEEPIRLKAKWLSARADGQFNFLKHPNLGIQQPSLPTFKGRVLILVNGGSYSTTAEFLTQAHTHRRATFIGEESGGAYFGNTSGHNMLLTLPNTKVRLVVPLMTFQLSTQGPHAADRGVMPDYAVQRTIADYLQGRDPEWNLALRLAKQNKAGSKNN
jgi:C-terminal processing protease CtpA/Prc